MPFFVLVNSIVASPALTRAAAVDALAQAADARPDAVCELVQIKPSDPPYAYGAVLQRVTPAPAAPQTADAVADAVAALPDAVAGVAVEPLSADAPAVRAALVDADALMERARAAYGAASPLKPAQSRAADIVWWDAYDRAAARVVAAVADARSTRPDAVAVVCCGSDQYAEALALTRAGVPWVRAAGALDGSRYAAWADGAPSRPFERLADAVAYAAGAVAAAV